MNARSIFSVSTALAVAYLVSHSCLQAADAPGDLWSHDNIAAWCIVPYDAKKRGPEERARMLEQLGIRNNEHTDLDAADALARNLAGLDRIAKELRAAK